MTQHKACLSQFKLLFFVVSAPLAGVWALPAMAGTAPDSFREKVIDVTTHCYPVFDRLSGTYWPDRDPGEVAELKQDARTKRDYTMDMLKRYSNVYSNFNIDNEIDKSQRELGVYSATNDSLLDMAVYCEKELFKIIDEEEASGYTP